MPYTQSLILSGDGDYTFDTLYIGTEYLIKIGSNTAGAMSGTSVSFGYENGVESVLYVDENDVELTFSKPSAFIMVPASKTTTVSVSGLGGGASLVLEYTKRLA